MPIIKLEIRLRELQDAVVAFTVGSRELTVVLVYDQPKSSRVHLSGRNALLGRLLARASFRLVPIQ